MSKMTREEFDLVCPAFNSNGKLGLIEMIVRTAYERHPNKVLYVDDLISRYKKLECVGVIKLIEFLTLPKEIGIEEIGSGSIDFMGVTKEEFSMESSMLLQEIYIGNRRSKTENKTAQLAVLFV